VFHEGLDLLDPDGPTCDRHGGVEAVWVRFVAIGLACWPTLSMWRVSCGPTCGPYWLHHSIQFSRFRRSERIRYLSCSPLSTLLLDLFRRLSSSAIRAVPRAQERLRNSFSEASGGLATAIVDGPRPYPIDPAEMRFIKIALHSSKRSGSSL